MILPVILSGGFGTRLWPLSNKNRPKQFLNLLDKNSLFQDTILRIREMKNSLNPLVICNEDHRFLIAAQLQKLDTLCSGIILEPTGRNTAPAITIAALYALENNQDPILLVLPSDHLITNKSAFIEAINTALPYANKGKLITFGVTPNKPETGYGYIQADKSIDQKEIYNVKKFVEKPNLQLAESYLRNGNYFWNSGIFMFRASSLLHEINKHAKDILLDCTESFKKRVACPDFIRLNEEIFTNCRSESIDYAVMEKTSNALVVPMDAGWSDLGTWSALYDASKKDELRNVKIGKVITDDVKNSYLRAENRTIAAIGIENLVIIETKEAVLVANKNDSQKIKDIKNQTP